MTHFAKTLLNLSLFAVFAGGTFSTAASPRKGNGERYVDLGTAAAGFQASVRKGAGQVTVVREIDRLIFYPDKRYAFFDGVRINLSYPLLMRHGKPCLAKTDCDSVITPFLSPGKRYRQQIVTIVLDPGHGGRDRGTAGSRLLEKNVTLNLAERVAKILRTYGYKVILTRTRDVWIPLDARSATANRARADLFVSIHANSALDRSVSGIETFCLTPEGAASSNAGTPVSRRYPGNRNNSRNFLLAYRVQRSLLKRTGAFDSGVKFARFAVLREVNCPAVLIETSFLSNWKEETNLRNPAYLDKVARGIAAGILNYHRSLAR